MITGQMVADKAKELCAEKKNIFGTVTGYEPQNIPYVLNGDTLNGMDCQGLIEWVLRELGIKANYKGTNDMWRNMLSEKGDIAYGVEKYRKIPIGAVIFICNYSTVPKGYKDMPDCEHVYLKIADKFLLHASSSNGKLMIREFDDKAVSNGGPTHYGLVSGVDYDVDKIVGFVDNFVDNTVDNTVKPRWQPRFSHLTFALGSLGNGTRDIQTGLNRLGYDLQIDGEFGPLTDEAVQKFQRESGLKVDGIVGPMTWAALVTAVNLYERTV